MSPVSSLCGAFFAAIAVVDCEGQFVYGSCSASCGTGTQTGVYTITVPASETGRPCPYSEGEMQSQTCGNPPCRTSLYLIFFLSRAGTLVFCVCVGKASFGVSANILFVAQLCLRGGKCVTSVPPSPSSLSLCLSLALTRWWICAYPLLCVEFPLLFITRRELFFFFFLHVLYLLRWLFVV